MRRLIAILLVLIILTVPEVVLAEEPAEGVIDGQVINQTEGGGSVDGIHVSLYAYIEEMLGETLTTRTDEAGRFQFTDLSVGYKYLISRLTTTVWLSLVKVKTKQAWKFPSAMQPPVTRR